MSKIFDKALNSVEEDVKRFVENSMDVADQIHYILSEKNITQRELADLLNKNESEISKWMSGTHNFTFRSISKLEAILGADIMLTPLKAKEKYAQVKFVPVKTYARLNNPYVSKKSSFEAAEISHSKYQSNNCKSA